MMAPGALAMPVLADVIPGRRARDVLLVSGASVFVGIASNVALPLPFTPVPLSLSTFAVLLTGAALGPLRAGLAMALYLAAGVAGIPWFAGQNTGWDFASFGYIIGYVVAAVVVGGFARRGADRTVPSTVGMLVLGNLLIYTVGVPWLSMTMGYSPSRAVALGVLPFLIGDGLKIAVAAGLLPSAWKLVGDVR